MIWFDADSTNEVNESYILKLAMLLGIKNIKEFTNISILLIYKLKAYQEAIIFFKSLSYFLKKQLNFFTWCP